MDEHTESVRDEDLRVGDMVRGLVWGRIIAIEPYDGPLKDIIFAIAKMVPGGGFSLERGGYTERVV
jgi:hypothetical protein